MTVCEASLGDGQKNRVRPSTKGSRLGMNQKLRSFATVIAIFSRSFQGIVQSHNTALSHLLDLFSGEDGICWLVNILSEEARLDHGIPAFEVGCC